MANEPIQESDNAEAKPASMLSSITSNGLKLAAFSLLATFFIALTQVQTKAPIEEQQRKAQLRALLEIVPSEKHDNDLLEDNIEIEDIRLGLRGPQKLFLAKSASKPHTLIYPVVARDGYSGDIVMIVGIGLDGQLAGARVLQHKETPGLGDGIETRKSDWILSFSGKSLGNPLKERWTVKKDGGVFDGFTGATITPRAVTLAVARTLEFHEENSTRLLKQFGFTDE